MSAEEYARRIIEIEVLSRKSFDEILQSVRADFAASGLTDGELDALVEEERQVIWKENDSKNIAK